MAIVYSIAAILLLTAVALLAARKERKRRKKLRRIQGATWCLGIYAGSNPYELSDMTDIQNPVLTAADITDTNARCIADPFMIKHNDIWYLFFEIVNNDTDKGDIGYATSSDLKTWNYGANVLSEPYHLSYPYVFSHNDAHYMIPEAGKSGGIHLYKAKHFPTGWKKTATLLRGADRSAPLQDPSIVSHNGNWYLFSYAPKTKNLHLFTATSLEGPWKEHPKSPIVEESRHYARPGGRIVFDGNSLFRYAQDSVPSYGSKVWGFRITTLTPDLYEDEAVSDNPVLQAGQDQWNNRGMHTIDPHKMPNGEWVAAVDGIGRREA